MFYVIAVINNCLKLTEKLWKRKVKTNALSFEFYEFSEQLFYTAPPGNCFSYYFAETFIRVSRGKNEYFDNFAF